MQKTYVNVGKRMWVAAPTFDDYMNRFEGGEQSGRKDADVSLKGNLGERNTAWSGQENK